MARRREARISFENSGVIGSLGELTPNITIPPNRYYTSFRCKVTILFLIHNAFAKNYIIILSLVRPIAIYTQHKLNFSFPSGLMMTLREKEV